MDLIENLKEQLVHLAGLAVSGDTERVRTHLMRQARSILKSDPALAHALRQVAASTEVPAPSNQEFGLRRTEPAWKSSREPSDSDSQLGLLRIESPPLIAHEPVYEPHVFAVLQSLVAEYEDRSRLLKAGLAPSRTALFSGPPGVGKTLAARWIARNLERPLFVLDLGAVMSRFLGATGVNLKKAFSFAKEQPCVLLLDELDAVAKRRDDSTDVGELKRLVTVLLQELDDWPAGNLLIGATNHPQLLDSAVWRRFEVRVDLAAPKEAELTRLMASLYPKGDAIPVLWSQVLPSLMAGTSHSEMSRVLMRLRRAMVLTPELTEEEALLPVMNDYMAGLDVAGRRSVALSLAVHSDLSDRYIASHFNVSRDTLRRARKGKSA